MDEQKNKLVKLYIEKKRVVNELAKQTYLNDLFTFNKEILQVEEGRDDSGKKRAKLVKDQKELCDFVQHGDKKFKLILMPRGHLKSTLITVGYSLQRTLKNKNVRILIGNATSNMAEAFLRQIKNHLKFNKKIHKYWGDLSEDAVKWTDNMVQFKSKESFRAKEVNLIAYGLGGSLVSQHYDLIIVDDPHNRENINTKDQIEKVKFAYKDMLDLLEPGGELIVIGTRWHDDDLYGMLMDKRNPESREFKTFHRRAIAGAVLERGERGGYVVTEGKVLWPGKYSKTHLTNLLNKKGLYSWSCQYQNEPVDDELAVFKRSWFKEYDVTEMRNRKLFKFTAIDPAISLKERADYTAIVTVGMDVWENIYILEIKRGRFKEKEMVDEIISTYQKFHPIDVLIETVAFQKTLQNYIADEAKKRKVSLPIHEVRPESGEGKEKRIRSLQPYYMRGNMYHNSNIDFIDYLEDELTRFPKGKHDDLVDALAYVVAAAYPPRMKGRSKEKRKNRYLY